MSAMTMESVPDSPGPLPLPQDDRDGRERDSQSSIYLLFSRKWVQLLGVRLPIWAHVAVVLVDRRAARATFFDVVSSRPRAQRCGT